MPQGRLIGSVSCIRQQIGWIKSNPVKTGHAMLRKRRRCHETTVLVLCKTIWVGVGSACHVGRLVRHGFIPRDFGCGCHMGASTPVSWVFCRYSHRGDFTFWSCRLENRRTTTLALGKRHVVASALEFRRRGLRGVLVQLPTVLQRKNPGWFCRWKQALR